MRPVRMLRVLVGVAALSVGAAACGGGDDSSTSAADKGTVVNVALGSQV